MCVTRWDGASWSAPQRVTESEDYDTQEIGNEGSPITSTGLRRSTAPQ